MWKVARWSEMVVCGSERLVRSGVHPGEERRRWTGKPCQGHGGTLRWNAKRGVSGGGTSG